MKYLLGIVLVLLTACSSKQEDEFPFIDLRAMIEGNAPVMKLVDLADEDRTIQFQTTETSLLYPQTSVAYANNYFYVNENKSFVLFDEEGNLIRTITRRGEGPEEYLSAAFIFLENEIFHLYDPQRGVFLLFSELGDYLGDIPVRKDLKALYPVGDGTYIGFIAKIRGNEPEKFILFDRSGEIIKSIPYEEQSVYSMIVVVGQEGTFFKGEDNTLNFKEVFNDTIYTFLDFQMIPRFRLELGEYKANPNARAEIVDFQDNIYENMIPVHIQGESDRYILFYLKNDWGIYDKQKNLSYTLLLEVEEDVDQYPRFLRLENECFLVVEKNDLRNEDNPVWHFYKIRE